MQNLQNNAVGCRLLKRTKLVGAFCELSAIIFQLYALALSLEPWLSACRSILFGLAWRVKDDPEDIVRQSAVIICKLDFWGVDLTDLSLPSWKYKIRKPTAQNCLTTP